MRADWIRTVDPTVEPVSVTEAKLHCRALQDIADEDGLIQTYLRASRQIVEERIARGLLTQTWKLEVDYFDYDLVLPMAAPLQSVTSVKYYDEDGVQQTLTTDYYRVDTTSMPGRIVRKPEQTWPSIQADRGQAVEVIYVVGWSSAPAVPDPLKVGIMLLADHLYENRGAVQVGVGIGVVEVPLGVASFVDPYRVYWRAPGC